MHLGFGDSSTQSGWFISNSNKSDVQINILNCLQKQLPFREKAPSEKRSKRLSVLSVDTMRASLNAWRGFINVSMIVNKSYKSVNPTTTVDAIQESPCYVLLILHKLCRANPVYLSCFSRIIDNSFISKTCGKSDIINCDHV